jgi:hypothetical protein
MQLTVAVSPLLQNRGDVTTSSLIFINKTKIQTFIYCSFSRKAKAAIVTVVCYALH